MIIIYSLMYHLIEAYLEMLLVIFIMQCSKKLCGVLLGLVYDQFSLKNLQRQRGGFSQSDY